MRCWSAFAISLTWLLCGSLAPVHADGTQSERVESLDALLTRLSQLESLRASYREEKRMALLKRPLVNEGTIYFAAPETLVRINRKPEASTVRIEGDRLTLVDGSGTHTVDLKAAPMLRHFVESFAQVLRGDRAALEARYRLDFTCEPSGAWRLSLEPEAQALRRFVTRMRFHGRGSKVARVHIHEANGDQTEIAFSDVALDVRFDAEARKRVFGAPANREKP